MPAHSAERGSGSDSSYLTEKLYGETLEDREDILLIYKTHLAVYLCKFGLTIGTKILITEALNDLKVAIHPSHHQELLKGLRRLW